VDMWYLHGPDRTTPYEVTMEAVDALYREGKFERLGISNYQAWEVARICEVCRAKGWKMPDVYQGESRAPPSISSGLDLSLINDGVV